MRVCADVHAARARIAALHAAGGVDCVAKQAEARHAVANNAARYWPASKSKAAVLILKAAS
jgi:hypothetical protein